MTDDGVAIYRGLKTKTGSTIMRRPLLPILIMLSALTSPLCDAYEWTTKKSVTLAKFTTAQSRDISSMRIGYETWGQLNRDRSNVILITHYFSGTAHAAGKYSENDKSTGYWDAIIGDHKAIDTTRFFVVSVDTPVNLSFHDEHVVTTGPASLDPATQKPYGLTFPVLQVSDFVNTQKAVLDELGVTQLYAVVGASGGAMQATQWAVMYPENVARVIAVIAPGLQLPAYSVAELGLWMEPILRDPDWDHGNYYGKKAPQSGVALALRHVTHSALSFAWEQTYSQKPALENQSPTAQLNNDFAINAYLQSRGMDRAASVDANHFLYTARAYQLYNVADKVKNIKAQFLWIPAKTDRLFPPNLSHEANTILRAAGISSSVVEIDGGMGHLDGVLKIQLAEQAIKQFLD